MKTRELMERYERWLRHWTQPYRLVALDVSELTEDGYIIEKSSNVVYVPDKEMFLRYCEQLKVALSKQPTSSTYPLKRGKFTITWALGVRDDYMPDVVCTGLGQTEFASLYMAIQATPGYPDRASVFRGRNNIVHIG